MKVGAMLTISVEYEVPDSWSLEGVRRVVLAQLDGLAERVYTDGLLSGHSDELIVEGWWHREVVLLGPEQSESRKERR
jgi:hypothetical protein